jgi:serine protease Do
LPAWTICRSCWWTAAPHAATLVGTDPDTDIALLKVDLSDLPRIRVGRSDQLKCG